MDVALFILSGLFLFLGLMGCLLPVLPGPPLSYIGLLILQLTDPVPFSTRFMVIMAGVTILVAALDYLIPVWGTKRFGGSRYGVLGTFLGLVAGLIFFPPFGIIIGPIIGALLGEYLYGRNHREASRAAFGSFVGFLLTTFLKLGASAVMIFYYFRVVF